MIGQLQNRLNHTVDDLKDAVARLEATRKSLNLDRITSLRLRPAKRRWPKALLVLGGLAAIGAAVYAWWSRCATKPKSGETNGTAHPDAHTEKVGAHPDDQHGF